MRQTMNQSIILYGKTYCEDSDRSRAHLQKLGVPFREVNIDHDADAERFVMFVNGGNRATPTVVIGGGNRRLVLTEPTDEELEEAVRV